MMRRMLHNWELGEWKLDIDKLHRTSQGIEESLARVEGTTTTGNATSYPNYFGFLFEVESRTLVASIQAWTLCARCRQYFSPRLTAATSMKGLSRGATCPPCTRRLTRHGGDVISSQLTIWPPVLARFCPCCRPLTGRCLALAEHADKIVF